MGVISNEVLPAVTEFLYGLREALGQNPELLKVAQEIMGDPDEKSIILEGKLPKSVLPPDQSETGRLA